MLPVCWALSIIHIVVFSSGAATSLERNKKVALEARRVACQELPSGDAVRQEGMDLGKRDQHSPKGASNELVGARKFNGFYPATGKPVSPCCLYYIFPPASDLAAHQVVALRSSPKASVSDGRLEKPIRGIFRTSNLNRRDTKHSTDK